MSSDSDQTKSSGSILNGWVFRNTTVHPVLLHPWTSNFRENYFLLSQHLGITKWGWEGGGQGGGDGQEVKRAYADTMAMPTAKCSSEQKGDTVPHETTVRLRKRTVQNWRQMWVRWRRLVTQRTAQGRGVSAHPCNPQQEQAHLPLPTCFPATNSFYFHTAYFSQNFKDLSSLSQSNRIPKN